MSDRPKLPELTDLAGINPDIIGDEKSEDFLARHRSGRDAIREGVMSAPVNPRMVPWWQWPRTEERYYWLPWYRILLRIVIGGPGFLVAEIGRVIYTVGVFMISWSLADARSAWRNTA